ncbi:MAG: hypothetical protein MZV70_29440 [Desulfobacterales bacterium]|nr:hypothetical protein [Desulfobacterales bacterium]
MMLGLQARGARNINLVSPSHVVLPVLRALRIALAERPRGPARLEFQRLRQPRGRPGPGGHRRRLPARPEVPSRPSSPKRYSAAPDYFAKASEAVREMSLQQPALDLGTGRNGPQGARRPAPRSCPARSKTPSAVLDWIGAEPRPPSSG